uniref:Peptidase A1 domain-containing protein n=1 Tax=Setaria viridis TaxID=4556 RepID=A0A4U6T5P0_SETVI|nr:LOW QUALITY PROTEIN: hypothetical protein SEVIR_9G428600v2 [Setaria viridis]
MPKLALLLALLAATAISCGHAAASAVRMQLIHTDAGRGLTPHELLQRMALRSRARAARILAEAAGAQVTPGEIAGAVPDTEYLVHFSIGTPPQPVQLTLDTGSDLTWTQCRPCPSCFDQALPYFDASLSSTFAGLLTCSSSPCQALPLTSCGTDSSSSGNETCGYAYSYGDGSVTVGLLVVDTFTFVADAAAALAFGCGLNNTGTGIVVDTFKSNEIGIAGFGRGALYLPSQLKADNFSYCFTAITGTTPSPVLLGLPANLFSSDPGTIQTITLIQNPARPSFYYLPLQGITVGSTNLPIPESTFAVTANGTGGTIIDSGTGMTSLPHDVYGLVLDAFVGQASLPVLNATSMSVSQLCFTVPTAGARPDVPKLVLEFEGGTLDLPRENYMFEIEAAGVSATCLAVNDGGGAMTIIGNYQQQSMHVLHDLANNKLSFVPAQCDQV